MKKIICILLAALMAAACLALTGCDAEKKAADPTQTPTVEATQTPTEVAAQETPTSAPATQAPPQQDDQPQSADDSEIYGGITSVEAAEAALAYAGEGYEVKSNERAYFRNNEAWLVGVMAFTEDSTIYYLYVNKDDVIPQTDIPDRSSGQSGLWGDITLDQAMQYAKAAINSEWRAVGSEQRYLSNQEAWYITFESPDGNEHVYVYVDGSGVRAINTEDAYQ